MECADDVGCVDSSRPISQDLPPTADAKWIAVTSFQHAYLPSQSSLNAGLHQVPVQSDYSCGERA